MLETRITVFKDSKGRMWYTKYKRKVFLFLRSRWKPVYPICVNSYEVAESL